ncbi:hypothetical protein GCM10022254_76250 [Actinomadura meridiana]|uniref:Uncharacterized protein n=1 Tax=Actinomadura meridiana TaxID=559626 RepID=A0ABP8CRQ6_9ACTN
MRNNKRRPRPQHELHRQVRRARRVLRQADTLAPWLLIGDASDGPVIGALLDEAATAIYLAKQALVEEMGRTPQEGEQTELDLTAPVPRSAVCASCGHRSTDHTEGLRCPACRCTDFTEAEEEGR